MGKNCEPLQNYYLFIHRINLNINDPFPNLNLTNNEYQIYWK